MGKRAAALGAAFAVLGILTGCTGGDMGRMEDYGPDPGRSRHENVESYPGRSYNEDKVSRRAALAGRNRENGRYRTDSRGRVGDCPVRRDLEKGTREIIRDGRDMAGDIKRDIKTMSQDSADYYRYKI